MMKTHVRCIDFEQRADTFLDLLERGILGNQEPKFDWGLRWVTRYKDKLEKAVLNNRQRDGEVHELSVSIACAGSR